MKAIIPVAGYATRLHPLTENKAKALLEVGDKEILAHFLDKLEVLGVFDKVVLVSNDRFYLDFVQWAENQKYTFEIVVLNDKTTSNENRLGAVGDFILGLREAGDEDHVLISAGDGIFEDSFADMLALFQEKQQSVIATKKSPIEICRRCGVAGVDEFGKVTHFVEKPEVPPSDLVGIMTYLIHSDHLPHLHNAYVAWESEKEMNAGESISYLVNAGASIYAYPIKGAWFDIGTHEHLEEAKEFFGKKNKKR